MAFGFQNEYVVSPAGCIRFWYLLYIPLHLWPYFLGKEKFSRMIMGDVGMVRNISSWFCLVNHEKLLQNNNNKKMHYYWNSNRSRQVVTYPVVVGRTSSVIGFLSSTRAANVQPCWNGISEWFLYCSSSALKDFFFSNIYIRALSIYTLGWITVPFSLMWRGFKWMEHSWFSFRSRIIIIIILIYLFSCFINFYYYRSYCSLLFVFDSFSFPAAYA